MSDPSRPPMSIRSSTARLGGSNNLDDQQRRALEQFKQKLRDVDHFTDADEEHGNKASHSDETLLRFLRARKYDLSGALKQFSETEDWRRKNDADNTFDNFSVDEFERTRLTYPQWTGRRDRAGIPLYVFEIDKLDKDDIKKFGEETDRLTPRMIAIYEHMLNFALPFTTSSPHSHPDIAITGTTTIVDIEGVGLHKFWSLREHLQRASALATAYYPETLAAVFVIGAPSFFGRVWDWIKGYFDEGTRNKIFIVKNEDRDKVLREFIDPANLPKKYGGQLEWEFGNTARPILDEDEQKTLGYDVLPKGPIRWVDGRLVVLGTGRSQDELDKYAEHVPSNRRESKSAPTKHGDAAAVATTAAVATAGTAATATSAASKSQGESEHDSSPTKNGVPKEAAARKDSHLSPDKEQQHHRDSTSSFKSAFVHLKDNVLHPSRSHDSAKSHDSSKQQADRDPPTDAKAKKEGEKLQEEPQHTIWDSAREQPAAPIKDLAAQLEDVSIRTGPAAPAAA